MNVKWPEPMRENGRLSESKDARLLGFARTADVNASCQKTVHISLFFDGTNNNDDEGNFWRDSKNQSHTNVARLFNAAMDQNEQGIFKYYIPGVGTPFPQIGEYLYSQEGKAFAKGFNQRCIWAYTRVLNSVYYAIASDKTRVLIPDTPDAQHLCHSCADGDMQNFEPYLRRLGIAHKQAVEEGRWPRTIKQIWINVIGFSRGAAAARAFVHKLINEWARGGRLGIQIGKYALSYRVNFMGLFDTVASVGLPDSTRSAINSKKFTGHGGFAQNGGLNIPKAVRYCVHAVSIHEQRMSFPLESIRQGESYADDEGVRFEIPYPGVHSDVGGGYKPGSQGKGCDSQGRGHDARKLSQIPLHDMYIAAMRFGVPLMQENTLLKNEDLKSDFALHPETITAFNAWLKTTDSIGTLEDAMKFGMGQILCWRTLRAQFNEPSYIAHQRFFSWAHEDTLTPRKLTQTVEKAKPTDPQLKKLHAKMSRAKSIRRFANTNIKYLQKLSEMLEIEQEIERLTTAIRIRTEALCGEVAHAHANKPLHPARPGEGPAEIIANDQTDLLHGAEEMRLLLVHLYPEQSQSLQVMRTPQLVYPKGYTSAAELPHTLLVKHNRPHSDSPHVQLVPTGIPMVALWLNVSRSTLLQAYDVNDDIVVMPVRNVISFLKQHTSKQATEQLPKAAIELFDDHVHDSRCAFRTPYFHEYAPGGYGWPRVIFTGHDQRAAWLGFDPLSIAMNDNESEAVA